MSAILFVWTESLHETRAAAAQAAARQPEDKVGFVVSLLNV
jgi:hypothetical protein